MPSAPKSRWPALPAEIWSALGPMPVRTERNFEQGDSLGGFNHSPREIVVDSGVSPATRWQTFGHELTHAAMWDGGCHDGLSHEQREVVCNALGTYLAGAVRAGYLKFTVPRSRG